MGFNHVSANPVPFGDPDVNLQRINGSPNLLPGGNATLIPAVAGKRISVHAFMFSFGSGNSILLLEETPAGATISTQLGGGFAVWPNSTTDIFPYMQWPWFTCSAGNALVAFNWGAGTVTNFNYYALYVQA